ncbi:protein YgfX [Trinickia fusca]|uniref:Uncharacterized protein n=1 Tax=Trinickia fusca TaxID=2419777 RepID=A0A494XN00_9BURK|nr:protein YgfX [Trinickia fusca]RKP52047.1 hypothetical protein D7S89_00345 [Trinickia fusca]
MTDDSNAFSQTGAPRKVALRRSFILRALTFAFVAIASAAVHAVVAPRGGTVAALALALATCAALMLGWRCHERRQPAMLEIASSGIAAFDDAGRALLRGRIAGGAQWARWLLVLAVVPDSARRVMPLVLAADALPADIFRELAVRARHASH